MLRICPSVARLPPRGAIDARRGAPRNYGFQRVERLDGNVGYIELRGFSGSPDADRPPSRP